jgi:hypothetical protein
MEVGSKGGFFDVAKAESEVSRLIISNFQIVSLRPQ